MTSNLKFQTDKIWAVCANGYRVTEAKDAGRIRKAIKRNGTKLKSYRLSDRLLDIKTFAVDVCESINSPKEDLALNFVSEFGFFNHAESDLEFVDDIINQIRDIAQTSVEFMEIMFAENTKDKTAGLIARASSIEKWFSDRMNIDTQIVFRQNPSYKSELIQVIDFTNFKSWINYHALNDSLKSNGHSCTACNRIINSEDPRKRFCDNACKDAHTNKEARRKRAKNAAEKSKLSPR